jgi:hypothetical protein
MSSAITVAINIFYLFIYLFDWTYRTGNGDRRLVEGTKGRRGDGGPGGGGGLKAVERTEGRRES